MIKLQTWLLIGGLLLGLRTAPVSGQMLIALHEDPVQVVGPQVKLGQIATISSITPETAQAARNIEVDSFESHERKLSISKQQILMRCRLAGFKIESRDLFGPDKAYVIRTADGKPQDFPAQIEAAILRHVASQYTVPESDLHVSVTGNVRFPAGVTSVESMRLSPLERVELPLGRQTFEATVPSADGGLAAVNITATVSIFRDLAIAQRDIPAGTKLSSSDIKVVRRPVATANHTLLTANHAIGKTTTSDIPMYTLIKPTNVVMDHQGVMMIKRNSLVTAEIQRGTLKVKIRNVKALTSAGEGEPIQIQNPFTQQRMMARVVDKMTVRVY